MEAFLGRSDKFSHELTRIYANTNKGKLEHIGEKVIKHNFYLPLIILENSNLRVSVKICVLIYRSGISIRHIVSPLERGDKGVCRYAFNTPPNPSF